ncbi:hypothetical protein JAAARDRAFT_125538, partial [Jaapia argillacea MUCL 33604]
GLRIAQVHAIFQLPPQFGSFPHPLVYVECFTLFHAPDPATGMIILTQSTRNHHQNTVVISVDRIIRSCHLMGKSTGNIDPRRTTNNTLEVASQFYFNRYISVDLFSVL